MTSGLPLIDLHRHLEGSIRPLKVLELAEQHDLPFPRDLESLRSLVQVTELEPDLMTFIAINGIILTHELTTAAPAAGLDEALLRQAQANAIAVAFLSERDKEEL
jgi:adenosine deaminase